MAGELGFEPRLTESESAVLPLDDSPGEQASHELHVASGLITLPLTMLDCEINVSSTV
jgi:hypothetical protein